jgi:hypothetical protein
MPGRARRCRKPARCNMFSQGELNHRMLNTPRWC